MSNALEQLRQTFKNSHGGKKDDNNTFLSFFNEQIKPFNEKITQQETEIQLLKNEIEVLKNGNTGGNNNG